MTEIRIVSTPRSRFFDILATLSPGDSVTIGQSYTAVDFRGEMEWEFDEDLHGTVASVQTDSVDVDLTDGRRLTVTERNATAYDWRFEVVKA